MPSKIKVTKFGGSSLADAEKTHRVACIVRSDPARKYIVVSAPGKRFDGDIKVTDLLYTYARDLDNPEIYKKIFERFMDIFKKLNFDLVTIRNFVFLLYNFKYKIKRLKQRQEEQMITEQELTDFIVTIGEYLEAVIMSAYLHYPFVNANQLIFFNEESKLDVEKTERSIANVLSRYEYAVIPGFYGVTFDGKIKTFPRNSSDTTATLIAKAVKADVCEIWTDVAGLHTADPKIIPEARHVRTLSYWEMRELAYSGAVVLAPDAILPLIDTGIPINIRNTNYPEDLGTMVVASEKGIKSNNVVTGIAGRKNFTIITIKKLGINEEVGYIRKVAEVFEKHNTSVEHMPDSLDTLSILVQNEKLGSKLNQILEDLVSACEVLPKNVFIDKDVSLITVVGLNMAYTPGVVAKIFSALAKNNINVRVINQGSSEINVIIGVANKDFEKAIKAIYKKFFV